MSWREDVVRAVENLGGEADLSDIYKEIQTIRPDNLNSSYEATIRGTIEAHSSDSEVWREGSPDLFRKVSRGRWALRTNGAVVPAGEAAGPVARLPEAPAGRVWIEFANHPEHGGEGWGFGECLWSPTRASDGRDWYSTMREVKEGDLVLHVLEGEFRGSSTAASAAQELKSAPPKPEPWGGRPAYYRITLRDFTPFAAPFKVDRFLVDNDSAIRDEFKGNGVPKFYPFRDYGGSLKKGQCLLLDPPEWSQCGRERRSLVCSGFADDRGPKSCRFGPSPLQFDPIGVADCRRQRGQQGQCDK